MQENARALVQKGDFDNAVSMLEKAHRQDPDNVEILRDLVYAAYLKRDFAKAIETGKELVEKPAADEQSFQVLGLAYKATASYKEAGKLYRTALKKFPLSGVIYNEYGEMYAADNELDEAIQQWEKGIEADPEYSSNYYNAAMYYTHRNNWIRGAIYGELFLNLESYSTRSEDMKVQLWNAWKNILAPGAAQQMAASKTSSAFEKAVLSTIISSQMGSKAGRLAELISARTAFVTAWQQGPSKTYPFRLFDQLEYLRKQGLFEAYNYWLFGTGENSNAAREWEAAHSKEAEGYKAFQQSRVYKQPKGQYYFGK